MAATLGKKKRKKIVLFLCTGDTCRGPMAQGYMKKVLAEKNIKNVEVRTAGVMTIAGLIPTAEAAQVMKNAAVDISGHRSTPLTEELIRKCDLILGMTPFHVQYALRMSEDATDKTFLLKEYAASDLKNYQITDPMGATLEVYKRVYREMKLAIDKMTEVKEFFTGVPEGQKKKKPAKAAKAKKPAKTAASKSSASKPAAAKSSGSKSSKSAKAPAKTSKAPGKSEKSTAKKSSKSSSTSSKSTTSKAASSSKSSSKAKKPSTSTTKKAPSAKKKPAPVSSSKKKTTRKSTAKK